MTTSKTILIIILAAFTLARVYMLGFVISKHGQYRKRYKHNGYSHAVWTSLFAWIVYELYNS